MKRNRATLKGYFETGDIPTQSQFEDLIDSIPNTTDDFASYEEKWYEVEKTFTQSDLGNTVIINPDITLDENQRFMMTNIMCKRISHDNTSGIVSEIYFSVFEISSSNGYIAQFVNGWNVLNEWYDFNSQNIEAQLTVNSGTPNFTYITVMFLIKGIIIIV